MAELVQLPPEGVSLAETRIAIDRLRRCVFINEATKIPARLSASAKGKLVSNKAAGKSRANGFTSGQHNALAANIDRIYVVAKLISSKPDRNADANIESIKRFAAPVSFGGKRASAWITVKESRQHGHHIYSVEAIKLETLDRKVEVVSGNAPHASSVSTGGIVAKIVRRLKATFGKFRTKGGV